MCMKDTDWSMRGLFARWLCFWWVIRCMMEEGRGGELESSDGTIGEGPFMYMEEFGLDFVGNG